MFLTRFVAVLLISYAVPSLGVACERPMQGAADAVSMTNRVPCANATTSSPGIDHPLNIALPALVAGSAKVSASSYSSDVSPVDDSSGSALVRALPARVPSQRAVERHLWASESIAQPAEAELDAAVVALIFGTLGLLLVARRGLRRRD